MWFKKKNKTKKNNENISVVTGVTVSPKFFQLKRIKQT